MIFILLLQFNTETLPPLPDISKIVLPEPPLYLPEDTNYLKGGGFLGDFYGLNCQLKLENIKISSHFITDVFYDTTRTITFFGNYSIPHTHFYLQPRIGFHSFRRDTSYQLISAGTFYSTILPQGVIFGQIGYDLWQKKNSEKTGNINIIFDRTPYIIHPEFSFLHNDFIFQSFFFIRLHLSPIHFGIGTPLLNSFPAPSLELNFLTPPVKIETFIKGGVELKTFREYFQPEIPVNYNLPVSPESLKLGFGGKIQISKGRSHLKTSFSYSEWARRLMIDKDYNLLLVKEINEFDNATELKNDLNFFGLNFFNTFKICYKWSDTTLPFQLGYSVVDSITFNYQFFGLTINLEYKSAREGLSKRLQRLLLFDTELTLKYGPLNFFCRLRNITGEKGEIFDDYFLLGRQYALGTKLEFVF